jgi:hypothetical protein
MISFKSVWKFEWAKSNGPRNRLLTITVPAKYFEKFKCEKSGAYLAEIRLCENAAEVKFSECEKFFLKMYAPAYFSNASCIRPGSTSAFIPAQIDRASGQHTG